MKIFFLIFLCLIVTSPVSFAEEAAAEQIGSSSVRPKEMQEAYGKVDSVSLNSIDSGTKSAISIIIKNGQKINFVEKTGAQSIAKT